MSIVERALNKLQQRSRGESAHERPARPRQPAALTTNRSTPDRIVALEATALKQLGFGVGESETRQIAEDFRRIKRPLLGNAFSADGSGDAQNLIMVTSAMPGAGKTFTALNLARSVALELDHSVVLVDADLPRASLTESMQLLQEPGLVELLLNESASVESLLYRTNVERLRILPAGSANSGSTELLASNRMAAVAAELRRVPGRIVIFDSPPLLLASEAATLGRHLDQYVLVVEALKTSQQAVIDSVNKLDSRKPIGLILNKAERGFPFAYSQEGSSQYYYYGRPASQ
jgi:exopolysaccharide/PEP-CTERM locus tyrosine autokinase